MWRYPEWSLSVANDNREITHVYKQVMHVRDRWGFSVYPSFKQESERRYVNLLKIILILKTRILLLLQFFFRKITTYTIQNNHRRQFNFHKITIYSYEYDLVNRLISFYTIILLKVRRSQTNKNV